MPFHSIVPMVAALTQHMAGLHAPVRASRVGLSPFMSEDAAKAAWLAKIEGPASAEDLATVTSDPSTGATQQAAGSMMNAYPAPDEASAEDLATVTSEPSTGAIQQAGSMMNAYPAQKETWDFRYGVGSVKPMPLGGTGFPSTCAEAKPGNNFQYGTGPKTPTAQGGTGYPATCAAAKPGDNFQYGTGTKVPTAQGGTGFPATNAAAKSGNNFQYGTGPKTPTALGGI